MRGASCWCMSATLPLLAGQYEEEAEHCGEGGRAHQVVQALLRMCCGYQIERPRSAFWRRSKSERRHPRDMYLFGLCGDVVFHSRTHAIGMRGAMGPASMHFTI